MEDFKIGDTLIAVHHKKIPIKYGGIIVIVGFCEKWNMWEYTLTSDPEKRVEGRINKNGKQKYFMSKTETFDYYYSKDKKHFKENEKIKKKEKIKAEIQHKKNKKLELDFFAEHNALLEKYGVEIYANQTSGDDIGVEMEIEYCFNHR